MPTALEVVKKFYPKVTKVVNTRKPVAVEIAAGDVKKSKMKDHKCCAMAMACKRQLPVDGVLVSSRRAYLIKGDTATRFLVPEAITREIVAFDRGAGFAPGTYTLQKPYQYAARGTGKRKQSHDRRAGKLRHNKIVGLRTNLLSV